MVVVVVLVVVEVVVEDVGVVVVVVLVVVKVVVDEIVVVVVVVVVVVKVAVVLQPVQSKIRRPPHIKMWGIIIPQNLLCGFPFLPDIIYQPPSFDNLLDEFGEGLGFITFASC